MSIIDGNVNIGVDIIIVGARGNISTSSSANRHNGLCVITCHWSIIKADSNDNRN